MCLFFRLDVGVYKEEQLQGKIKITASGVLFKCVFCTKQNLILKGFLHITIRLHYCVIPWWIVLQQDHAIVNMACFHSIFNLKYSNKNYFIVFSTGN